MSNEGHPGSRPSDDPGRSGENPEPPPSSTGDGQLPGYGSPAGYGAPPSYGTSAGYGAPTGPAGGYPGTYPGQQAGYPLYGQAPPTYLWWAIGAGIAGVLFNLILGLPLSVFAARSARQVPVRWYHGDAEGARKSSRNALTLCIIATVLDALGLILVLVVFSHGSSSNIG